MRKILLLTLPLFLIGAGCTSVCDEYDTVASVETEVIPTFGADDSYYHYTFESGNKEVRQFNSYRIGEEVCVKSHYEKKQSPHKEK
jgi:hypothetical protein